MLGVEGKRQITLRNRISVKLHADFSKFGGEGNTKL